VGEWSRQEEPAFLDKILPDFDTPTIAKAVEALTLDEINRHPYGVIGRDPQGVVRLFNSTKAQLSGYGNRPSHGKAFFTDVAPCMNNGYFKGLIDQARAAGTLDIHFSFIGDFADRNRELTVRVQSATDGGTSIFLQRPAAL
jgi:photoactive yellow protein